MWVSFCGVTHSEVEQVHHLTGWDTVGLWRSLGDDLRQIEQPLAIGHLVRPLELQHKGSQVPQGLSKNPNLQGNRFRTVLEPCPYQLRM